MNTLSITRNMFTENTVAFFAGKKSFDLSALFLLE
jgi:hypothetical protein